jgi:hypothetical protein
MPISTSHFPIPVTALILLAAPLGCGSGSPGHPEAGGGHVVARSAPTAATPDLAPDQTEDQGRPGQAIRALDQDVRRTAEAVESGIGGLQGEVTRAVGETRTSVQGLADAVRDEAAQDAEQVEGGVRQAVDQVVGGVQREVEGAKGDVRRRAQTIRDGVARSARGLKKDVVDGLFGPSEE